MTHDQASGERKRATISPMELRQIREAVNELRASSPKSVLADLVEEKLRAIAPTWYFSAALRYEEGEIFRQVSRQVDQTDRRRY